MTTLSIRLPDDVSKQIDVLVAESGQSKSDIIRDAIEQHLQQQAGQGYSLSRIAEIMEYVQLAVQHHLLDDEADKHEQILDLVDERLIEHHGR